MFDRAPGSVERVEPSGLSFERPVEKEPTDWPTIPLRGSLIGDIDTGIDICIDTDKYRYVVVSIKLGVLSRGLYSFPERSLFLRLG